MRTDASFSPSAASSPSVSSSSIRISLRVPATETQTQCKYPAKSHARRVAQQLGLTHGLIYLAGEVARNNEDSDMPAVFRQKRYFYYLTGFDYPDAHVTYDLETDTLTLWILRPDPKEKLWSGPSPTPKTLVLTHDIDMANYTESLPTTIAAYILAHPGAKVHILHDYHPPLPPSFCASSGSHNYSHSFDNKLLQPAIDVCRVIKDDHEIQLIRRANEISTHGHLRIMSTIDTLTSERDIEALFIAAAVQRGAGLAYDTIACSGRNCSILHYVRNDQPLAGKQLVLLDAGAEYGLYASDVTRTFPINGRFTPEAAEIYALVRRMQDVVFAMLKPGVRWRDCHLAAADAAVDGLMKLGVLVGDRAVIVKSGILGRVFFPHGLGHHVGLEVHDVLYGELISKGARAEKAQRRRKAPVMPLDEFAEYVVSEKHNHLQPGMVVTVEPGVYFNKPLYEDFLESNPAGRAVVDEAVLEKYWDVGGVRIEDCVLVKEGGFENLTRAPKEIAEIEGVIALGRTYSIS
ncbi:hypothetical protein DRE_03501 [Drechslerella stenobrocha 248]|uniref:Xaa-Pro aminopeptidase n=1 Tax=Drechslerella stenobrocha 248 TaxID=1043628 RepID=W7I3Z9_9PEZI|nr:hypothetical protein DRE_03501 [Drechslerella stenobrocha 248]